MDACPTCTTTNRRTCKIKRKEMTDQNLNNLEKLTDGQLDPVAGGFVLDRGERWFGLNSRYVIIDDQTGDILTGSDYPNYAATIADGKGVSQRFITVEEYEKIFGRKFPINAS